MSNKDIQKSGNSVKHHRYCSKCDQVWYTNNSELPYICPECVVIINSKDKPGDKK